ncbi:MAG: DUF1302 family protein [Sphaerochaetaceae bacterium]
MKLKKWIFIVMMLSLVSAFSSEIDFSGYVRNYTGVLLQEDSEFPVLQNSFDMSIGYQSNKGAFLANPYLNINKDTISDIDFRELYIDLFFTNFDVRIGKQQVVWGKADGVFITDVVSPKNLQEFMLPDFKEIRIGVNAAKVNYYIGGSMIELIWVPQFVSNTMPSEDSIWNTRHIDFSNSADDIDTSLENSEYFARYSIMTSLFDLELVGGYMWDDEPTITAMTPQITFKHERLAMAGGSVGSTVGDFVLRSEGAYYTGKDFVTSGNLLESDYIHYMAGLDYSFSGYKISTQFIQKAILNYDDSMVSDQFSNTMTFMINKKFLRDTLTTEFFTYVEFGDLNALLRPKLTYAFDDGISLIFGANFFVGNSGTYGQFDKNDMAFVQIKYNY